MNRVRTERPAAPDSMRGRRAGGDLARKQRDRRGDVGGARVQPGVEQRREGQKRAAAGQRILRPGHERGQDKDRSAKFILRKSSFEKAAKTFINLGRCAQTPGSRIKKFFGATFCSQKVAAFPSIKPAPSTPPPAAGADLADRKCGGLRRDCRRRAGFALRVGGEKAGGISIAGAGGVQHGRAAAMVIGFAPLDDDAAGLAFGQDGELDVAPASAAASAKSLRS